MLIEKKRINSIDKYLANVREEKEIYVCVPANENNLALLSMQNCVDGTCVVPEMIGPVTRFNLLGKYLVHKELEKKERNIERDYHIVDWHGTDHYGTCVQTKMCYPKEFVFPPLSRIILDNQKLRSELMKKSDARLLKHTINMFLEIFKYCEIVGKDEVPVGQKMKVKEVSWEILPPGKYPWERAEKLLENYFEKSPRNNKEVLRNNHKTFSEHNPDFLAIGENSFSGYVVYGYTNRSMYIFESNESGNATYVFKGEWENASKLTKYDIIQGNLCHKRLIHAKAWKGEVEQLFEE